MSRSTTYSHGVIAAAPTLDINPLTAERWDDVAALFEEGGDPKTCWCMYWRVRARDWSFNGAAEARAGFKQLVDRDLDPAPGLLAFQDGRAVGWVSLGPRDAFHRLEASRVRPTIDDVPVWSIVCFVVSRRARSRGIARALLAAAVSYAERHAAPAIEAYPVDSGDGGVASANAYSGTLSTFLAAGFHLIQSVDSPTSTVRRVIVRRDLRAPSESVSEP